MAGRMDLIIDKVLGHMWLYFSLLLRILISKTNRSRKPKKPKALVKNFQLGKFSIPTWNSILKENRVAITNATDTRFIPPFYAY
ncbi:MAG TPA: hypothetical protein VKZ62_00185 [Georgenia sp.]|nr:hypothetical protein [Georgenia sp.]